jgi:hypothetical protein
MNSFIINLKDPGRGFPLCPEPRAPCPETLPARNFLKK